jgi:hypothetical protein
MRMLPCQSETQREDQNREDIIQTSQKNKLTDLLIPFDKIGHSEKLFLALPDKPNTMGKIQIQITTNGFTKTLQICDYKEETEPIHEQTKINKQLNSQTQMIELFFSKITFSIIHNKSELITIFISKLNSVCNETLQHKTFRFTVGYL